MPESISMVLATDAFPSKGQNKSGHSFVLLSLRQFARAARCAKQGTFARVWQVGRVTPYACLRPLRPWAEVMC